MIGICYKCKKEKKLVTASVYCHNCLTTINRRKKKSYYPKSHKKGRWGY